MVAFGQERVELIVSVEVSDKLGLKIVLDIIYQEVHNRLGHGVLNAFPDDEKIALDELLNDFAVVLFSRRQFSCGCCDWLWRREFRFQIFGLLIGA